MCCDSLSIELNCNIITKCILEIQQCIEMPNENKDVSQDDLNGMKQTLIVFEESIKEYIKKKIIIITIIIKRNVINKFIMPYRITII